MSIVQIIIVNLLTSLLPLVLSVNVYAVIFLFIVSYSMFEWKKQLPISTKFAYILLGLMLLTTTVYLYYNHLSSALYSFLFFTVISIITISYNFSKNRISSKPIVSITQASSIAQSTMKENTNKRQSINEINHDQMQLIMRRMDVYFETTLSRIDDVLSNITQKSNESLLFNLELLKNEMIKNVKEELTFNSEKWTSKIQNTQQGIDHNLIEIEDAITERFLNLESLFDDLNVTLSAYDNNHHSILSTIEELKLHNAHLNEAQIAELLIDLMQKRGIKNSTSRFVENQKLKDCLYRAFEEAESEICIISPWLGKWLTKDPFRKKLESTLKRGVNIKIVYGIEGKYDDDYRGATSEMVANELKNKWLKKGYAGTIYFKKSNTHYKLLICDNIFYVQGSYNFLSNQGDFESNSMWHEAGDYSEDKDRIKFFKEKFFVF